MDAQTPVSLAQVVQGIAAQVATLAAIVAPITYAVGELVKKITIKGKEVPGWVAGLLSAPVGILVVFLINGMHFTGLGILTGALAGLSTAGIYGTVKGIAKSAE